MSVEVAIEGLRKDVQYIKEAMDSFMKEHEKLSMRIQHLENWKLQFVARFTAYATVALTVGSFLAQILIQLLGKWF